MVLAQADPLAGILFGGLLLYCALRALEWYGTKRRTQGQSDER
jgi:hypothetical protein